MALTINNPRYGNIFVVADTFAELRTVSTKQIHDGYSAIVAGDLDPGDGFGGMLVWNSTSTAPDDSRTVIASQDGQSGRWIKIAVGEVGPAGPVGPASTIPGPLGPQGPAGTVTPEANALKIAAQAAAVNAASSASTSQIASDSAQSSEDAAANFAGAAQAAAAGSIYPTTAAGLAAQPTEGAPFLVQGGPANAYATLYRNIAGAAVSQNLSIPSLAALADLKTSFQFQSIKAITAGGNLPNGVPTGSGGWLIPPAANTVVAATNGDQLRKGVQFAVNLAPGAGAAFQVGHTHSVDLGQYVYGNVIVSKANGAAYPVKSGATEYITVGNVPKNGGAQQGFAQSNAADVVRVEDISANSRRYVIGGLLTTVGGPLNFTFIYVQNTTATTIQVSAFAVATSPSKASDIDYTDYDPTQTGGLTNRVVSVEQTVAGIDTSAKNIAQPIPAGGDLADGQPKYQGSWLVAPTGADIVTANDAALKSRGVKKEHHLATGQGSYFRIDIPTTSYVANGNYVMGSVTVRKKPADAWSALDSVPDFFTVSTIPTDNGTQQAISVTNGATRSFEVISPDIRRYKITAQLTQLSSPLSWVILFPHAFPIEVWTSAYAFATSNSKITDINYANNYDPARDAEYNTRISNIEAVVSSTTPQAEPLLLFPSSLPVIQGQSFSLYRTRLTELGTSTAFKFAAIGRGARLEEVRWDDGKQLALDGARLSGAGYIVANNATGTFRRPVNFRSSPATKAGSPVYKLLTIGDSLSQQGQTSIVEAKLRAAGVNLQMLGTFKDTGGSWGETRASWAALTYTNAQTAVNSDGSGGISPVTSASEYLGRATPFGTPNDDYGPRWGSNPFIRPATGNDPVNDVKNGYIFDFAYYLNRYAIAVPDAVDINLLMNDFLRGFNVADSMQSIDIMVRSIHAVSQNIVISFGVFGHQSEASQSGILAFTKAVLAAYGGREAERFYVLPLWEVVDPELGYTFAATIASNAYGVEKVNVSDGIHPPRSGVSHAQWAQLRFAHHMNVIPN